MGRDAQATLFVLKVKLYTLFLPFVRLKREEKLLEQQTSMQKNNLKRVLIRASQDKSRRELARSKAFRYTILLDIDGEFRLGSNRVPRG